MGLLGQQGLWLGRQTGRGQGVLQCVMIALTSQSMSWGVPKFAWLHNTTLVGPQVSLQLHLLPWAAGGVGQPTPGPTCSVAARHQSSHLPWAELGMPPVLSTCPEIQLLGLGPEAQTHLQQSSTAAVCCCAPAPASPPAPVPRPLQPPAPAGPFLYTRPQQLKALQPCHPWPLTTSHNSCLSMCYGKPRWSKTFCVS